MMLPRPFYSMMYFIVALPAVLFPLGMFLWILTDGPCAWYAASCNVVYHVHLVIFGVPVIALSILWLAFVVGRVAERSPWRRLEINHVAANREGASKQTCSICGWDFIGEPGVHGPICPGRAVPVKISRRTVRTFEHAPDSINQ